MKWFRPVIVTTLSLAVTLGFFQGLITSEFFASFATGLVIWWFKSRDEEKRSSGGQK